MRSTADGGKQVAGQGHMDHLLNRNLENRPTPAPQDGYLLFGDAFLDVPLDAESGEKVTAHYPVLQFRGFGEQVDQLGPVVNPDGSFHYCLHLFPE